jgi:hypothetical protein
MFTFNAMILCHMVSITSPSSLLGWKSEKEKRRLHYNAMAKCDQNLNRDVRTSTVPHWIKQSRVEDG